MRGNVLAVVAACAFAMFFQSPRVAARPIRVFILAGQSNMVGLGTEGELAPELRRQDRILYDFYNPDARDGGSYADATSRDWEALTPKGTDRHYGPEITFARDIQLAHRNERIAIIKMAQGGTNIVDHWGRGLPAAPADDLQRKSQLYHALLGSLDSARYGETTHNPLVYPNEVTRVDNALRRLDQKGLEYEIAGLIWMQGENEAVWDAAFTYGAKLSAFIAALREDLKLPHLLVVLGRISKNMYEVTGPDGSQYVNAVRRAQVTIATCDPYATWVNTDDLAPGTDDGETDFYHFDSFEYQRLGSRFAAAYLALAEAVRHEHQCLDARGGNEHCRDARLHRCQH